MEGRESWLQGAEAVTTSGLALMERSATRCLPFPPSLCLPSASPLPLLCLSSQSSASPPPPLCLPSVSPDSPLPPLRLCLSTPRSELQWLGVFYLPAAADVIARDES